MSIIEEFWYYIKLNDEPRRRAKIRNHLSRLIMTLLMGNGIEKFNSYTSILITTNASSVLIELRYHQDHHILLKA